VEDNKVLSTEKRKRGMKRSKKSWREVAVGVQGTEEQ